MHDNAQRRRCRHLLALIGIATLSISCATPPDSPPASNTNTFSKIPLKSIRYERWRGCYRLTNDSMRVVVVPEIGRIMELALRDHENALRINPDLRGKSPRPGPTWMNFGGDWLWPVAQTRWTDFAPANWPPPPPIADAPWQAEAWQNSDGSQSCYLSREFGPPLNVLVSRLITVDHELPQVRVIQRMVRLRESDIPVALWNITQVPKASSAYMPFDAAFDEGFRTMMFEPPVPGIANNCDGVWAFDTHAGQEFKLGSNPTNAWIAAQHESTVLMETPHNGAGGVFPDGGCSLELYCNPGLGYTEIETLSPEVILQPGETLENALTINLLATHPAAPPCEVVKQLQSIGR